MAYTGKIYVIYDSQANAGAYAKLKEFKQSDGSNFDIYDGVKFLKSLDKVSDEELKEHYALADVFILPTRYDIWGLVINEAMSFGLPVITSDKCVAGMHFKALNDSVIVVENENVEAYAEAMKNLYENASLRKEKESLSFEIIQTNTVENGAKDLINHLKEIV